jgi:hypothetical protein
LRFTYVPSVLVRRNIETQRTRVGAQLGDHRTPAKRIIKFTLGDLNEPSSRIDAERVKGVSWKLSRYSGRLVIMAHGHGLGVGAPYDLGATAAPITSSRQMAETVRR